MVYVFQLVKNGTWLDDFEDPGLRRDAENLIRLLGDALEDAAISLTLFEEATKSLHNALAVDRDNRELLPNEFGMTSSEIMKDREERWALGAVPRSYVFRLPFLHARSCVYALDTIAKVIRLLSEQSGAPRAVMDAYADMADRFPFLTEVRDSAHHPEDRIRWRARSGPIVPAAIDNGSVRAPEGAALFVGALNDNRYGGTAADGTFREFEVSPATVDCFRSIIQKVFDAYRYRGSFEITPR